MFLASLAQISSAAPFMQLFLLCHRKALARCLVLDTGLVDKCILVDPQVNRQSAPAEPPVNPTPTAFGASTRQNESRIRIMEHVWILLFFLEHFASSSHRRPSNCSSSSCPASSSRPSFERWRPLCHGMALKYSNQAPATQVSINSVTMTHSKKSNQQSLVAWP